MKNNEKLTGDDNKKKLFQYHIENLYEQAKFVRTKNVLFFSNTGLSESIIFQLLSTTKVKETC